MIILEKYYDKTNFPGNIISIEKFQRQNILLSIINIFVKPVRNDKF